MGDLLPQIIFYVFAVLTIISAVLVITQNNPVRCVLFLVFAFFCSSVLWMLLQAEFLALILVLVYVGAVMTLFLFVVMMLNIDIESMKKQFIRHLPLGLGIVILLTALFIVASSSGNSRLKEHLYANNDLTTQQVNEGDQKQYSNTEALGLVLYTDYALAFELAAVILLVSIIAAISLVHQNTVRSKRQNVVQQIMTRRDDRVTLIKMKSENKS